MSEGGWIRRHPWLFSAMVVVSLAVAGGVALLASLSQSLKDTAQEHDVAVVEAAARLDERARTFADRIAAGSLGEDEIERIAAQERFTVVRVDADAAGVVIHVFGTEEVTAGGVLMGGDVVSACFRVTVASAGGTHGVEKVDPSACAEPDRPRTEPPPT